MIKGRRAAIGSQQPTPVVGWPWWGWSRPGTRMGVTVAGALCRAAQATEMALIGGGPSG